MEGAVNRAYYGAFHAATAALASHGEAPKTHAGAHRRFHALFVQTGMVSPSASSILKQALNARVRADYDSFALFDPRAVADLIRDVQRFIDEVDGVLGGD